MALNGLPLPHDPYTLLNGIIIPRNLYDRYFLLGGLKLDMNNSRLLQLTPNNMLTKIKTKTTSKTGKISESFKIEGDYDKDYSLDTKYYNELKNQLQDMTLDQLKDIVFSQLEITE